MGRRKFDILDSIVVVDVESTCWDVEKFPAHPRPSGMQGDIIEVGVTFIGFQKDKWKLPRKADGGSRSFIVRPTASYVSPFCTELTGWTQEDVIAKGNSFQDICNHLSREFSRYTWASWGEYDRRQFERQCERENAQYPWGRSHINVKRLHALKHGYDRALDVSSALKSYGMAFEGNPHSGVDDSHNIARILCRLLND